MANTKFISQSLVKRRTAAALAAEKDRRNWSDNDAAEALGVCRTTIQNRLDGDDPGKQMTIHELLRSVEHGDALANDILSLVDRALVPIKPVRDATCDRKKASSITRASLAVAEMLEDEEVEDQEIRDRRSELETARDDIDKLLSRIGPRNQKARAVRS